MINAFKELLDERIDEASIEFRADIELMEPKNEAEILLGKISDRLPENSKDLMDDLRAVLVDILATSEEFSYRKGYSDAVIVFIESLKMCGNTGQIQDRRLKSQINN